MRNLSLILLLLLIPVFYTSAQEFKIKLYAKDSAGKTDSIVIGLDPLATDFIDSIFDEENIYSNPWDSLLEIRAGEASVGYLNMYDTSAAVFHSKIQIANKTCEFYHMIKIVVKCTHFPLEISWDTASFTDDSCLFASYITTGTAWGIDWFDGVFATLNPENPSFTNNRLIINEYGYHDSPVTYSLGGENLLQMMVSFSNSTPVNINEIFSQKQLYTYPNPSNGVFDIIFPYCPGKVSIDIYDLRCKLIKSFVANTQSSNVLPVNVVCLPDGVYFLSLNTTEFGRSLLKIFISN